VASPASCRRDRGRRRRLPSSDMRAPPASHIPKRYVTWAGCWAARWASVPVSRSSIFFCSDFFSIFCFQFLSFQFDFQFYSAGILDLGILLWNRANIALVPDMVS
jgi:hypothetical protein